MSNERLRAVVVGGHIGRSHAHGYIESDRTDLVGEGGGEGGAG